MSTPSAVVNYVSTASADPKAALVALLDDALRGMTSEGSPTKVMDALTTRLGELWSSVSRDEWSVCCREVCQRHPLYDLFGQDPFTRRARDKPRGYAGDAVMIDYIYRGLPEAEERSTTTLGRAAFNYTAGVGKAAKAVRARRDLLASRIDATADRVQRPRILSIACGHLREVGLSKALAEGRVGSLCALDQDAESLAVVASDYGHVDAVQVIHGSVKDLLTRRVAIGDFDLIYAAGLFDYLPDRIARGLMTVLAGALNGGGELLVGNFMPDPTVASFLEAIGDWPLLWRSQEELNRLSDSIPTDQIASINSHVDAERCISYVTVSRV